MRKQFLLLLGAILLLTVSCVAEAVSDESSDTTTVPLSAESVTTANLLIPSETVPPTPSTNEGASHTTAVPISTRQPETAQTTPSPAITEPPVTTAVITQPITQPVTKPVTKPVITTVTTTVTTPAITSSPVSEDLPSPPETEGENENPSVNFGDKFAHKFSSDGTILQEENVYRSSDLCIEITKVEKSLLQKETKSSSSKKETQVIYYVVHIYVRNLENLFSAHQVGTNTSPDNLLKGTGTVFAINGDVFNTDRSVKEVIIRNGEVIRYKRSISADICVLYRDGSMEVISPDEYDWNRLIAKDPYQVWSFGPGLLQEDGTAKTNISSNVWRLNPRAAIGYVEPGHYVMVIVDGSRDGKTTGGDGMNMDELAKVMEEAGCLQAYNLDGGASVYCYFQGEYLVSFTKNRKISDMICVGEIK